ncbi:MAG: hypothetical protein FWC36_10965 [Spirochaetes bacterium]|nr:hypothetical protein [Spirochaetota bacterium]
MAIGCYFHEDEQAVAQCKRCGKGICRNCVNLFSKPGNKYAGLCRECVLEAGIECGHHPSKQAAALCRGCGTGICRDCYDTYGVSIGDYAGTALCYKCTAILVQENIDNVTAFRKQVKKERIWMVVGAVLGLIVGLGLTAGSDFPEDMVFATIFLVFIGASLGTIVKLMIGAFFGGAKGRDGDIGGGFLLGIISGFFLAVVSPIITIYRFIKRFRQIKKCDEIIASDENALRRMRDYFAYTLAMENNKGVDLAKLAEQGSELFDNTYAQSVLKNGEKAAQAGLRESVVTISANGEIIRNFDKKPRERATA